MTTGEINLDMPSITPGARINLPQGRALQLGPSAGDIALAVQQVAQQAVNQALEHANAHLQQAAQMAVNQALKIASDHWQAVLAEREQHLNACWRSVLEDMLGQLARKLVEQLTGRSCIVNFFCDGTAKVTTQRGAAEERRP